MRFVVVYFHLHDLIYKWAIVFIGIFKAKVVTVRVKAESFLVFEKAELIKGNDPSVRLCQKSEPDDDAQRSNFYIAIIQILGIAKIVVKSNGIVYDFHFFRSNSSHA